MKKNFTPTTVKLTKYSAMAAAFIPVAQEANAQIIYNDVEDITVELYDSLDYDLDDNGTPDFRLRAGTLASGSWTFASLIGYIPSQAVGSAVNVGIGYSGSFYYYLSTLNSGDPINAAANFIADGSSLMVLASNFYGSEFGMFGNEGPQLVGYKFNIDGSTHYGWMRLDVTLEPASITLIDYAYNNTPDGNILAGQTQDVSISDNSNTAFVVYNIGKTIVVKSHQQITYDNTLEIFATNGEKIASQNLSAENTQINMHNKPSGLYFVHIKSEKSLYTQKVTLQ